MLMSSKLSATNCIGKKMDHSVLGLNFGRRTKKLDVWWAIYVFSLERPKVSEF